MEKGVLKDVLSVCLSTYVQKDAGGQYFLTPSSRSTFLSFVKVYFYKLQVFFPTFQKYISCVVRQYPS